MARIGRAAGDDHLGLVGERDLAGLVVVDQVVLGADAVGHGVEPLARLVDRLAVGQVAAVVEVHPHEGVAGRHGDHEHGLVGLAAGVHLAVDHAGLKGGIGFREVDGSWGRAEGGEHRSPKRADRHANLEAFEILRRLDRPFGRGDLAETVVPDLFERQQPLLLDLGANIFAEIAVHGRPHLIVARKSEADAVERGIGNERRQDDRRKAEHFDAARTHLVQHVGIGAELARGEDVDRHAAAALLLDLRDGFLRPHVHGMGKRLVVGELVGEFGGIGRPRADRKCRGDACRGCAHE